MSCDGDFSCRGANVTCGAEACELYCDGRDACNDVDIACGDGPCSVTCGFSQDVCEGLEMQCGGNDGFVDCSHQLDDVITHPFDGSSCGCEAFEC